VKNLNDLPFTLTPQQDRRQVADRRTTWRGGRRAADHAGANVLPPQDAMLWTLADEAGPHPYKPILH
jgi:hypothetical protein